MYIAYFNMFNYRTGGNYYTAFDVGDYCDMFV